MKAQIATFVLAALTLQFFPGRSRARTSKSTRIATGLSLIRPRRGNMATPGINQPPPMLRGSHSRNAKRTTGWC